VYFTDMALALAERIALDPHAYYFYSVDRVGSLQSGKDKTPFAVFEAYGALEAGLREKGVWPMFSEAFFSVYLLALSFNLRHLVEADNVKACWLRFRENLRRLNESDGLDKGRLHTPWLQTIYAAAMDSDSPERAVELMRRGKPSVRVGWIARLKNALVRVLPFTFCEQMRRVMAKIPSPDGGCHG
jgi:hypothetical protein